VAAVTNHDIANLRKASRRKVKGFQVGEYGLGAPTLIDGVDIQEEPAADNRYEDQSSHPA
jgi:hypothetical protein